MTIWKFTIDQPGFNSILMPQGARLLDVQIQRRAICVWAIIDPNPNLPKVAVSFLTVGTGHGLPTESDLRYEPDLQFHKYFRTVQIDEFVWHVFTDGIIEGRN